MSTPRFDAVVVPTREEMRHRSLTEALVLAGIALMALDGILTTVAMTFLHATELNPAIDFLIQRAGLAVAMSFKVVVGIACIIVLGYVSNDSRNRWGVAPLALVDIVMATLIVWMMYQIVSL